METNVASRPLTQKQRAVYEFIFQQIEETGIAPTHQDIADKFSMSAPSAAVCHINAIRKRGYIGEFTNRSRSYVFILKPDGSKFRGFRTI